VTPATLAIPPPHQSLFVVDANAATAGVYVFAPGANGNVAPTRAITGSNTGIGSAWGIALDSSGNIYVSDNVNSGIKVFAPDANGNVAPIRTISGSSTMLTSSLVPRGLAVDASGNLWAAVPNITTFSGGYVVEYATGANGNVAPIAVLSGSATLNDNGNTVAFDPKGTGMHVAMYADTAYPSALLTYPLGASGNTAPTLDISGTAALGIGATSEGTFQTAFDANGNQYVAVQQSTGSRGSVLGWPLTATGNVAPTFSLTGSNTNLNSHVRGIGFDSAGYLYASVASNGVGLTTNPPNSIFVFAPGASGNTAPVRTIAGSNIPAVSYEWLTISP
jgi:hypothetical protein